MTTPTTTTRGRGAAAGLIATAAALGVGQLVGGLAGAWRSPIVAVAETVIERSPKPITRFGIETFGKNDKLALIVTILAVLAILGAVVGILARRRPVLGPIVFGVFALAGAGAALQVYAAGLTATLPSIAAGVAGAVALRTLLSAAASSTADAAADDSADVEGTAETAAPVPSPSGANRRAFLGLSAGIAAAAALATVGGQQLRERFSAVTSRRNLVLADADAPLPAPPAGIENGVEGMRPFFTPNDDFYRIDTALVVPQVRAEDWELRIHGMVDRELVLTFDELVSRGLIEADITMTCISNQLNGDLIGHARWLGVPLQQLLDEVGVDAGADQIVGRSIDGYTCGFPVEAAADRNAIVAVGMNGEPLPLVHGFPARLVTPGLYGFIGSTKWLTEIELTTFADFDQYWVPRGYADRAPIKTMTRVDVPRSGTVVPPGQVVVGGSAWAQTRGISKVEVKLDQGDWQPALLADELNVESWRQWSATFDLAPGSHRVAVRATDGLGQLQTDEISPVLPNGASGLITQLITVSDGS